jgi:hypothetical protein
MSFPAPDDDTAVLRHALAAFLEYGFHAVRLSELEAATSRAWDDLCRNYRDKEGLFLAAAEQGLIDGSIAALGKEAEVRQMLERLERVNGNPRLRAIHKQSLDRMRAIAEERLSNPFVLSLSKDPGARGAIATPIQRTKGQHHEASCALLTCEHERGHRPQ